MNDFFVYFRSILTIAMSTRSTNQRLESRTLSYAPLVVIMGKTGAGKTTLCNKLCGTNHAATSARGSVTQNLYQNPVNCGSSAFNILDTPGTDSTIETYKHALLLKEALTGAAINTIFVVIKYHSRFDNIIMDYGELEVPVSTYADKIIVMISHWDQSHAPDNDFRQIRDILAEEYPSITNIIFYSEQDSSTEIANLMFRGICNMQPVTLTLTDEEFHLNFNIYQMRSRIQVSYKQFQAEAKKKEEEFNVFIRNVESESQSIDDKDEKLHMIIVTFKEEMETLLAEFIKTHGNSMQELESYGCHIRMQKEIIKICNEFTQNVAQRMSYSLFDSNDPRNLIKRCPNCNEIWYKTEGCDGATNCGNNEFSSYYDIRQKPFWKFTLERVGGIIRWGKIEKKKRELPPRSRTNDGNKKGCGTRFEWGKLPPIEEEKIKQLFQVKTIQEAKEIIRNANFTKARQEYTQSIDFTRHS
jgi:small GTP-binding protein